jgi:hypothetical protein
MAEAMWFGKPVIATGYSGNLDFMTAENSLLVDHRLVPIGPDAAPYPAQAQWAEPDVEHAAALMRQVFDDPGAARDLGASAAHDIRRTHSPAAAGEIMVRRLESIRATGRPRAAADHVRTRPAATSALAARIQRGAIPATADGRRSLRSSVRRFTRKAILRMMRPFTAYQQTVNSDVVAAMDELSARTVELRRAAATERARLLGELRRYEQLPSRVEAQARTIDEIKRQLTPGGEGEDGLSTSEGSHHPLS